MTRNISEVVDEQASLTGPPQLFTVQEAAARLNLPPTWLYERTRKNAIPCRRFGKYVRFSEADLDAIVQSGTPEGPRRPRKREQR